MVSLLMVVGRDGATYFAYGGRGGLGRTDKDVSLGLGLPV